VSKGHDRPLDLRGRYRLEVSRRGAPQPVSRRPLTLDRASRQLVSGNEIDHHEVVRAAGPITARPSVRGRSGVDSAAPRAERAHAAVREPEEVTVRNHSYRPPDGTVTDHPESMCHGSIGVR
jgi:hypothetical protein